MSFSASQAAEITGPQDQARLKLLLLLIHYSEGPEIKRKVLLILHMVSNKCARNEKRQSMKNRLGNIRTRKTIPNCFFPYFKVVLIMNILGVFFFVKGRKVGHMRNKSE